MKSLQEIDNEILSLEEKLRGVKGTDTEVYTRIVGYHRAVSNWNKGKREEYDDRLTFKYNNVNQIELLSNLKVAESSNSSNGIDSASINSAKVSFYMFFSSKTCRNCPSVKDYIKNVSIPGEEVDVTTDLGLNVAREYGVMTTPTVILFDSKDNILGRVSSVGELKKSFN